MESPNTAGENEGAAEYVRREMLYETARNAIEGARTIDDVKTNINMIIKGMEEELNCTVKKDDVERVSGLYDETVELLQSIQNDIIETAPQALIGEGQLFENVKLKEAFKYYFYEKFKSPELIAKFSYTEGPDPKPADFPPGVTAAAPAAAAAARRGAIPAAVAAANYSKDLTFAYSQTFDPHLTLRAAANRVLSRAAIQAQALCNQYSSILNIYEKTIDLSDKIHLEITQKGIDEKMSAGNDKFQVSPPTTLVSALSSYIYAQISTFRNLAKTELDTIRDKINTYNTTAGAAAGATRVTQLDPLTAQQITRINNSINMDLTYVLYVARNMQSLSHLNFFKEIFGYIPPNITRISSIEYTKYNILRNPNVSRAVWDVQNSLDPQAAHAPPPQQEMVRAAAGGAVRYLFPISLDTALAGPLGGAVGAAGAADEIALETEFNNYSIYNTEALFEISDAVSADPAAAAAPAGFNADESHTILTLYTAAANVEHNALHAAAGAAAGAARNKFCVPAAGAAAAAAAAAAAGGAGGALVVPLAALRALVNAQNLNPYLNQAGAPGAPAVGVVAPAAAPAAPAGAFADRNLINNVIENFILLHINEPLSTVPTQPLLGVDVPLDINGPTSASLDKIKEDILELSIEAKNFKVSSIIDPIKALQNIREWTNWIYLFNEIKEKLEQPGEKQIEKGFLIRRIEKIKLLNKRSYIILSELLDIKAKKELCDGKKIKFEADKEIAKEARKETDRKKQEKAAKIEGKLTKEFSVKLGKEKKRTSGSANNKKVEGALIKDFIRRNPAQTDKLEKFRLLKRYTELFLQDLEKIKDAILKYSVALVKPGTMNIFDKPDIPVLREYEGRASNNRDIFESSDFVTTDESYKSIETSKPTTIFSLTNIIIEDDRTAEVSSEIKGIHKLINEVIRLSNNPKVNNTFSELQKMTVGGTLEQDNRILNAFYSFYSEVRNFTQIYNNLTNINHPGIIKQWLSLQEPKILQDKLASKLTEIVPINTEYPPRPGADALPFPTDKWDWINRSCGHILTNISTYDNCFKSALTLHNNPVGAAAAATDAYNEVYELYLKYQDYPLPRNTISGSLNHIAIDSMALSQIAANGYYGIAKKYYEKCLANARNLPEFYSSVYIYAAAAAARAANLTAADILGPAAAAPAAAAAAQTDADARNAANEIITAANNARVAGAVNIPLITPAAAAAPAAPAAVIPILELVNSIANGTEDALLAAARAAAVGGVLAAALAVPADYAARAAIPAAAIVAAAPAAAAAGGIMAAANAAGQAAYAAATAAGGPGAAPLLAIVVAGHISHTIENLNAELLAAPPSPGYAHWATIRLLSLNRDGQINNILQNTQFLLRNIIYILYNELYSELIYNNEEAKYPYRDIYLTIVDTQGVVATPGMAGAALVAGLGRAAAAAAGAAAAGAAGAGAVAAAAAAIPPPALAAAPAPAPAVGQDAALVAFEAAAEGAVLQPAGALVVQANHNPINFLGVFDDNIHTSLNTLRRLGVFEPFESAPGGTLVRLTEWAGAAPVAPGAYAAGAAAAAGVAAGAAPTQPQLNQRLITECCAYLRKFPEILPPEPLLYIVDQKASCVSSAAAAAAGAAAGQAHNENCFNAVIEGKANIGIQMMRLPFLHMIRECKRNNIYTQAAANTMYHHATIAGGDIIATNCLLIIHQVLNALVIEYSNRFYAAFSTVDNPDAKAIHQRAEKLVIKEKIQKSKMNSKLLGDGEKTDYTQYMEECMKSLKNNKKLCNIIYNTPAYETLSGILLEGFDDLPKPEQARMDLIYPGANANVAVARKPAAAAGAAANVIVLERAPQRAAAGNIPVATLPKGVIHYIKLAIPKVKEQLDNQLKDYCKSVKDLYNSIDIMKETRIFSLINSIFNFDVIGDNTTSVAAQTKAEELITASLNGADADVTAAVGHYTGRTGLPKRLQSIARAISGYWQILYKNTDGALKKKGGDMYNRFLPINELLRSDPRMCLNAPPAPAPAAPAAAGAAAAPAAAAGVRPPYPRYDMKDSVYNRLSYNLEYVKAVDEDKRTNLTPGLGFSAKTTLAAAAVIHFKENVNDFTIDCASLVSSEDNDKPFNPSAPAAAGAAGAAGAAAGNLDGILNSRKIQLAVLCARIKGIEEIEKGKVTPPANVLAWKALVNNVKNSLSDEERAAFTALKAIASFTLDSYDTEKKFITTATQKANLYTLNHPDLASSEGPAAAAGGGAAPARVMVHNKSVLKLSYMIAEGCKRMHYYYDAALGLNKHIGDVVGKHAEYKKIIEFNKQTSHSTYNSKNILDILCGRMSETPEDIPGLTEYKLRIKDLEAVEKRLKREAAEVSDSFQRFLEP